MIPCFCFYFETVSHSQVQAGLEVTIEICTVLQPFTGSIKNQAAIKYKRPLLVSQSNALFCNMHSYWFLSSRGVRSSHTP